jgi:hypothetical protein
MKKIILSILVVSAFSALAISGYKFYKPIVEQKEEPVVKEIKTDLFAINELIAVIRQFRHAKTIDAAYTTVLTGADGTEYASFDGRYIKDSLNFYLKSIGSENLINKQYFIAIDHSQQMVFIEKPDVSNISSFLQIGFLSDIDSLVNLPDSFVYFEKISDETGKLTVEWGNRQFYKTELIYNLKTKVLKRVHLYPYKEIFMEDDEEGEISDLVSELELQQLNETQQEELPEYVAIIYKSIRLNELIDPKWFDSGRFIKVLNGRITPSKTIKNYEIDFE